MIQTKNPTQTVLGTRAQATRRVTERVGKRLVNMACDCGADVCFLGLTSTSCSLASSLVAVQLSHEAYKCSLGRCWDNTVTEESELVRSILTGDTQLGIVHPTGRPISVSTQRGLSLP